MFWDDNFRKLFFDFHNHEMNGQVGYNFDAESFAKKLEEVGAESVNIFTHCTFGYKYYQKGELGEVHPNLKDGLDMVEECIEACHKRNIKVMAYFTPSTDRIIEQKPEYIHKTSPDADVISNNLDKTPRICRIGPGGEYVIGLIKELLTYYDVDSLFIDGTYVHQPCYCDSCMELFKKDTGFDIPVDRNSSLWKIYLKWYFNKYSEFRRKIIKTAKDVSPDIPVYINWIYTFKNADIIPDDLEYLFADITTSNQTEHTSLVSRSFALTGKKYELHPTAFLSTWGEWGLVHKNALKRDCAVLLANGTNCHIGYQHYPEFGVEEAVWDTFKDVFDFVKEREEFLKGSSVEPYIGAFYSKVSIGLTHSGNVTTNPQWLFGFHKLMMNCGLHYNLLSTQYIEEKINDFEVVILPDVRYLSEKEVNVIKNYVKNGGKLISIGLTGTLDDKYNYTKTCVLNEVLGIEFVDKYDESLAYTVVTDDITAKNTSRMPLMLETTYGLSKVTTAKSLASLYDIKKRLDGRHLLKNTFSPPGNDTGYTAISINKYGKGKAVYFAGEIGEGYYKNNQWNLTYILKNILYNYLIDEPLVQVTNDGTVEVVLGQRGNKRQVHLINMVGTMPPTHMVNPICHMMEVVPIHDIIVKVKVKSEPRKVLLQPEGKELDWYMKGNVLYINLDRLDIYSIIEIE